MTIPARTSEPNIHQLFSPGASRYAAARPRYPEALFDAIAQACPDLERAWDCATGSGQAAVSLAHRFKGVEATDVSAEQITNAFQHERVRYSVQRAEQTAFADSSFSLVTVAQALHWFNFDLFWPEVRRVLKPGGLFVAWGYDWPQVDERIDRIVQTDLLSVIEPYWAANNRLLWNRYADIPFPFEEIKLPPAAIALDWTREAFLQYLQTWSATRRCIEDKGDAFFQQFAAALRAAWNLPETSRTVKMDIYCRAGK